MFKSKKNREYLRALDESGIFDNTVSSALPQTVAAGVISAHLAENDGRIKRVLVYAYDGARADSMFYLVPGKEQKYTGYNCGTKFGAVSYLKEQGGLYLTFAGGEKDKKDTLQETSTAQGFAAILTGEWGNVSGVKQHVQKKDGAPTVLLEAARQGRKALFSSIWRDHFTVTYKGEIEQAKEERLPLEFYQSADETELQSVMINAIENGTDLIFGINEFPDGNGHSTGFGSNNYRYVAGVANADRYAFELIEIIEDRKEKYNEDWLIITLSDHGGHGRRHGTQSEEDRMTFLASNKKI